MPFRLVLFDLVGTLLDEESDYEALDAIMDRTAARFGLDIDPKTLSGEFTLAFMEVLRGEPDDNAPAAFMPFQEAAKEVWSGLLVHHGVTPSEADVAWFWAEYVDIQRSTWRAYPEVRKTLEAIAAENLLIGVVTDADRFMVEEVLPAVGIEGLIDVTVTAEEAGHPKPHPRLFQLALERAGVKPTDAIMVGDSYERDIEGARAAGILHTILVDRHGARTVAVTTVRDLKAVPRAIHQVGNGHAPGEKVAGVRQKTRPGLRKARDR